MPKQETGNRQQLWSFRFIPTGGGGKLTQKPFTGGYQQENIDDINATLNLKHG